MKLAIVAGVALMMAAMPAVAQSTAEGLRAQLSDQVMTLRGYDTAQRPTGESVRLRLFESGAAQMRFRAFEGDEQSEDWALWRINARNQFCTTYAVRGAGGVLSPAAEEDCLDFRLDGNQIGLNFYGSTGNIDRYSGRLRPM